MNINNSKIQIQTVKKQKSNNCFVEDFNDELSCKTITLPIEEELEFCEKNLKNMLNIISDFKHKSIVKDSKIAIYYALKLINLSEKICLATRNIPHYIDFISDDGYGNFEQINEQIANVWDIKICYTKQGWLQIKLPIMLPKIKQHNAQIIREGSLKQSTIERYETVKSRVYSALGHMKICNIKAMHIQRFINNLAEKGLNGKGMSIKSQALHLIFLSNVFNYAIRYSIVSSNPCRNVRTIKKETHERDCYTLAEAQTLLEKLKFAEPKYRTFFTLAIYTGFRRGELLGLEWKDIDFNTGIITVNRVSQYLKGGITTGTPKTSQSQRSLKVPDEIIELLKWYKKEQALDRLKVGDKWQNTDRLFTKWDGSPMYPNTPGEWFGSFCKKNNLKYVTVHSFRHLNATLLISNGVDIKTVSKALGHSQTSTTLNIYAHSFAEQQARASEAIANVLRIREKDA